MSINPGREQQELSFYSGIILHLNLALTNHGHGAKILAWSHSGYFGCMADFWKSWKRWVDGDKGW